MILDSVILDSKGEVVVYRTPIITSILRVRHLPYITNPISLNKGSPLLSPICLFVTQAERPIHHWRDLQTDQELLKSSKDQEESEVQQGSRGE